MVAVGEIHVEHIANFRMLWKENESQYVLRSQLTFPLLLEWCQPKITETELQIYIIL